MFVSQTREGDVIILHVNDTSIRLHVLHDAKENRLRLGIDAPPCVEIINKPHPRIVNQSAS